MTKKICISGYYGFNNFGDETILKILIDNLKQTDNNIEINVFSSNPEQTKQNYNVNSSQTFDLKEVIKKIKACDCLISGGGSLLQDVTSIKSLIYYLTVLAFAQLFRKKTIIFAQGIGPINNKFLAKLTAFILKNASFVSVRDNNSFELLKSWGIKSTLSVDPVWNINPICINKTNKIGIQLRGFKTLTDDIIKQLADCINEYYKDKEIILLSLQNEQDLSVCNKLKQYLNNAVVYENTSNEKIIKDIASCEALIAMRYHACLIAIKNNVKLLPLSYDIKVENLAKEFNLNYIDLNGSQNIEEAFKKFINGKFEYKYEKEFDFSKIKEIIF